MTQAYFVSGETVLSWLRACRNLTEEQPKYPYSGSQVFSIRSLDWQCATSSFHSNTSFRKVQSVPSKREALF